MERKNFQIHNEEEQKAFDILDAAGTRKSELLALAVLHFSGEYGITTANARQFLDFHDFLKAKNITLDMLESLSGDGSAKKETPNPEQKKEKEMNEYEDMIDRTKEVIDFTDLFKEVS